MLWKRLPMASAVAWGMGRDGDSKAGFGSGGTGMFSLVGKIKMRFLRPEMPIC